MTLDRKAFELLPRPSFSGQFGCLVGKSWARNGFLSFALEILARAPQTKAFKTPKNRGKWKKYEHFAKPKVGGRVLEDD